MVRLCAFLCLIRCNDLNLTHESSHSPIVSTHILTKRRTRGLCLQSSHPTFRQYVCVKSFRKKNKEFKTAPMTSFTLLLNINYVKRWGTVITIILLFFMEKKCVKSKEMTPKKGGFSAFPSKFFFKKNWFQNYIYIGIFENTVVFSSIGSSNLQLILWASYPWVIIIITTAKYLQNNLFYLYNTLIKWKEKY